MKNGQIVPSKVCHFQYDNRFVFSREMGNIRGWEEVRLQKKKSVTITISVDGKRILFPVKLKLEGELFE